jgi:hypothetical protein
MHGSKLEIITFDEWYSFHCFVCHDGNSLHSFILQTSHQEGGPPHNYTIFIPLPSCSSGKLFSPQNLFITFGNIAPFFSKNDPSASILFIFSGTKMYIYSDAAVSFSADQQYNGSAVKKRPSVSKSVEQMMYTKKDC